MGCKIEFINDTNLDIAKADAEESSEGDNLYAINDSEGVTLYEINTSQIKYIKWY